MIVLLAGGAGVTALGLLAILFGLPISDTSFGNALLIGGVVVLCTGLLILSMWFVGRQLERIAVLLSEGQGASSGSRTELPAKLDRIDSAAASPLFPTAGSASDRPVTASDESSVEAPAWTEPGARNSTPPPPEPDIPPPPPEKPRRNLLFETRRRDKVEPVSTPKPPVPDRGGENEPKPSFDDAWSGPPKPDAHPHASAPHEPEYVPVSPQVTVIKSGVVDGMAYSLYSDGSIEAQMPAEGLIRFASLDALREYLDQRP